MTKLLSYFTPQKLEVADSSFNGQIEVVESLGKPRIIVNNLIQSGGMMEVIWNKAIKKANSLTDNKVKSVLILGLGGGSVAHLIGGAFPRAKITGVEIDSAMIKLGKKYFDLDKIKNLKIINDNAIRLINNSNLKLQISNLVLVDLYLGSKFPPQAESSKFLKNLKKLVSKNGIVIFNRLFYQKHCKLTEEFIKKLEKQFSQIELVRAWSNLLVFCNH